MFIDNNVEVLEPGCDVMSVIKRLIKNPEQAEAFHIIDLGDIVRKHGIFKKLLPNVTPFYAVKSNNNDMVVKVLAAIGVNFDCASQGEMRQVLSLGVHPDRIIFAQTMKMPSHLRYAASQGVLKTTFDCSSELHKIKALHPKAELVIRLRSNSKNAGRPQFGRKFGCCPFTEARELLEEAKTLGMNIMGITFNIGSNVKYPEDFGNHITECREVYDIGTSLGHKITLLDLGGGYPGDNNKPLDEYARVINTTLARHFSDLNLRLIAEPGRFYQASSSSLVCCIISKRAIPETEGTTDVMSYCINESIYNSFNFSSYERPTNPYPVEPVPNQKLIPSTIWGQTCDGNDKIMTGALLPDLDLYSWIVFENMGSYTIVMRSVFNGFSASEIKLVIDGDTYSYLRQLPPIVD